MSRYIWKPVREVNNIKYNKIEADDPRYIYIKEVEEMVYDLYSITKDKLFTKELNKRILNLFRYI